MWSSSWDTSLLEELSVVTAGMSVVVSRWAEAAAMSDVNADGAGHISCDASDLDAMSLKIFAGYVVVPTRTMFDDARCCIYASELWSHNQFDLMQQGGFQILVLLY